jgi:E3 ubiquitin-protein ligase NEDD4
VIDALSCQHCSCLQTHQKKASDPITDSCEPPCGCWELNSGSLEEQSVLITAEPPLQPGSPLKRPQGNEACASCLLASHDRLTYPDPFFHGP